MHIFHITSNCGKPSMIHFLIKKVIELLTTCGHETSAAKPSVVTFLLNKFHQNLVPNRLSQSPLQLPRREVWDRMAFIALYFFELQDINLNMKTILVSRKETMDLSKVWTELTKSHAFYWTQVIRLMKCQTWGSWRRSAFC